MALMFLFKRASSCSLAYLFSAYITLAEATRAFAAALAFLFACDILNVFLLELGEVLGNGFAAISLPARFIALFHDPSAAGGS